MKATTLFITALLLVFALFVLLPHSTMSKKNKDDIGSGKKKKKEDSHRIDAGTSECTGKEKSGDKCMLVIGQLRPTQLPYGRLATKCKSDKFEGYKKLQKLTDYLVGHPVPVVIGPDREFYMTDHHHMVRAYYDSNFVHFDYTEDKMNRVVFVEVIDNQSNHFSPQYMNQFWDWMLRMNYTYPLDNHGRPLNVTTDLPKDVTQLANDPFRSLSFLVRSYGGYGKVDNFFFLEFVWANYFRRSNEFTSLAKSGTFAWTLEETEMLNSFKPAMKLSKSAVSGNLPGYGKGEKSNPGCDMWDDL